MSKYFRRLKFRPYNKRFIGFDIETYGKENRFLMASLYCSEDNIKEFYDKESFFREIRNKKYNNSVFVASNLGFDFFGMFFGEKPINYFTFIESSGKLIGASCYVYKGEFYAKKPHKNAYKIEFIDTMNYASLSVANLGRILNLPKLETPESMKTGKKVIRSFDGIKEEQEETRMPGTLKEWEDMIDYNIRDSEISKKFMDFFNDAIRSLGGNFKLTIASTAMSLFRTRYVDYEILKKEDPEPYLEEFKAYKGGRVEAFARGYDNTGKYSLYDVNSLYPSVMVDFLYPDPRTRKKAASDTLFYIKRFMGISECTVTAPDIKYPLLPHNVDGKLLFPTGTFRDCWTHAELNKALELGYKIDKVHSTIYYENTMAPFKRFITDLYNLRLKYKKQKSPMEYVCKILMNASYGKFGERFDRRIEYQPFNKTVEELKEYDMKGIYWERKGDYIKIQKPGRPKVHCIPIWAVYVTSYARLRLYSYIEKHEPVYCDTDSIITSHKLSESDQLGKMKKEYDIKELFIVKPKVYSMKYSQDGEMKEKTKFKGVPRFIDHQTLLTMPKSIQYEKFVKFRESISMGVKPNTIIDAKKKISYDDNKREWNTNDFSCLEFSKPLKIVDGMTPRQLKDNIRKAEQYYKKKKEKEFEMFKRSDFFDDKAYNASIGFMEFVDEMR